MTRQNGKVLLAVMVALFTLAAPTVVLATKGGLVVDGSTAVDTTVVVRVSNTSNHCESGTLTVTAVADGVPISAARSVTVESRGADYVAVDFGSHVDVVLQVKMVEGNDPM